MKINLLRQKILDLAIRGKLVPQDPNDEPASILLERIRAEKDRLIAEGKIKRPKKAKTTSSESHYQKFTPPFAIPESWEWVTLPDVCKIPITDGTHKTPVYSDKKNGVPFLSSKDVTTRQIDWDNIKYIDKRLHEELYARLAPMRYDILLAKNGTTGVAAMVDTDCVFDIYVTLALIRPMVPFIYPKYLLYVINSNLCKEQFNTHLTGIGLPNLHLTDIKKTTIPLPPLEEQIKIVKEIDDLLSIVNLLEQNKETLADNIKLAKSKILDLAMQGKLVPQDPADEPAADMLRRINPKAKIITDNPQYQQLPSGWCVTTIKDVFEINPKNKAGGELDAGFVPMASIADGFNNSFDYTTRKWKEIKNGFTHFADGDIAVAKISPCLENRKSMILNNLPNGIGSGTTELLVFRSQAIYSEYGLIFFKSDSFINHCVGTFNGVVGQQRVGKNIVEDIHIPIPPLEEQKRIVKIVRNLFGILNEVESNLLITNL